MLTCKLITPFSSTFLDYPDNHSNALLIYMMGCDNCCKDCQNLQFKDPNYNINTTQFTVKELVQKIVIDAKRNITKKIVLSGGDPCSEYNIKFTKQLFWYLEGLYDICVYTGKGISYIKQNDLKGFTYLKCGNYIPERKQLSEKTDKYISFASSNQELYDSKLNLISTNGVHYFNKR